jgi:putative transcriptional regulator
MNAPFANKLRAVRDRKNLTQEELASAVGVSRQTIISIEKGKYVPSVLLAMNIARHFGMTVEDIFNP